MLPERLPLQGLLLSEPARTKEIRYFPVTPPPRPLELIQKLITDASRHSALPLILFSLGEPMALHIVPPALGRVKPPFTLSSS